LRHCIYENEEEEFQASKRALANERDGGFPKFVFPNYQDYGYGIFLLDEKSREYVLKHIGEETDPFLRSMMWGSLWDSVREGELDPREYVELAVKQLEGEFKDGRTTTPAAKPTTPPKQGGEEDAQARASARAIANRGKTESDETIIQALLGRVSTALNYNMPAPSIALANARASASGADSSDLRPRLESVLLDRMQHAETAGQRITFYRAYLNIASSEKARGVLKGMLTAETQRRGDTSGSEGVTTSNSTQAKNTLPTGRVSASGINMVLRTKDKFDIVTRLIILGDPEAPKLLADLEKTETGDDAKRYAYAAHAAFATAENRERSWNDFVNNKDISESWIEAAIGPFNSIRHTELSLPYLQRALAELPRLKRDRKIFFVNGWLAAFIGGQRSQEALDIVNKFLADNPALDKDLRLKILENSDLIERAVKIRRKWDK
jgi:aminopeptidase N